MNATIRNKFTKQDVLLHRNDQVILANLRTQITMLHIQLTRHCNLEIFVVKTKVMAFQGQDHIRRKICNSKKVTEKINCFKYLNCYITYKNEKRHPEKI